MDDLRRELLDTGILPRKLNKGLPLLLLSALLRLHGPTVTVVLLVLAVGIPVLYSYLYYRRHEKGGAQ